MDPADPRFRYLPLSRLVPLPRNAKAHDAGLIATSMERWGYLSPIIVNETTGHDIAGNGRVETLLTLQRLGHDRPAGIALAPDGDWLVPAYLVSVPERDEAAAALSLNKVQEAGGWDGAVLADVLTALAEQGDASLDGTGWDRDDLDDLMRALAPTPGTEPTDPRDYDGLPLPLERERPADRHGRVVTCPACGEEFVG